MPRNGSGVYTLPQAAFTPSTTISSSAVNSDLSDIAAQMTNSLAADGQTTMTGQIKAQAGTAAAPSYAFGTDLNTGFYSAGSDVIGVAIGGIAVGQITSSGFSNAGGIPTGIPIGTIVDYAGSTSVTVPSGWQLCAGQSKVVASFPDLFAVIGYTYGGSGPNFSLPDCRGRATFGRDNMGGSAAGRITVAGGNFDGTVLGSVGGQQSSVVAQTNLATFSISVTITDPGHHHTYTIPVVLSGGTGSATVSTVNTANTSTATTGITAVGASGGGNIPLPTLSNAIIFNKLIFAGA